MQVPFPLEVGQTYYRVTHADAKQTMPGLEPLVYIGKGKSNGLYWFQDAVSYMRFGSRLEMKGDQPEDVDIYFMSPDSLGSDIQTLAQAVETVAASGQRAIDLGHPKLPVLREGWFTANPPAIWDTMVNMDVPDLHAAVRFYEEGIGLTLKRRLFGNTVAEMEGASSPIYLLEKEAQSDALPQGGVKRDYARHWTPVHLDFVVNKLEPAIERAVAAGATLETGPTDFVWGRQATFSDPFGHGICLVQWLGRGYGEVE
jgi:predicted enzyme related to lactoylglutathione lyase